MNVFVCTGFWCLPGQDDRLVAGTLHVSRNGDLRLSLIGTLGEKEQGKLGKVHRIVLGSVDDSPRGNAVTLTGCTLMGASFGSYHGGREEYRASRAYFGTHLASDEDFRFRSVLLKIGGLSEWARSLSGLDRESPRIPTSRNAGETVPIATYRVPTPPSGRLLDATVTLNFGVRSKSDTHTFRFHEQANLQVEFDAARTADEINARYVYPLQNLMTFAADHPQKVESVSLWRGEDLADWERNPEIRLIGPRVQPDEEKRKAVRSDQMLLTLADVEFASFLESWLRLAEKYAEAFNIYFGTQYGPPSYIDITYALVAQSVSLYYARTSEGIEHRGEEQRRLRDILPSLQNRDAEWLIDHLGAQPYPSFQSLLQRLVGRLGFVLDPILANRRDAFVNQAAATLRYIERQNAEECGAASHGAELYWLMQKLRFLIKACFLAELGFGTEQIRSFFNRNVYFQHISGLETARQNSKAPPKAVDFSFQFVVPADAVMEAARKMATSTNHDEREVGKTLLDLTEVTDKTKAAVADVASKEQYDLAVYFDYKLGDSLEAAKRLMSSPDANVRHVAQTLISQSDAIVASKASYLEAANQG
jgi:ApeA N-terminal domain 1